MNTSNWTPRVPSFLLEKRRLNVLLVDHAASVDDPIIDMLEHYFLKVTTVKYASTALSILSRGSPKVDVVMENIKSPDLCGFKLLQDAVERNLHVMLLLEEDDYVLTKMAVEAGALICITKPITMGMADCLWQIVVGENLRRIRRNTNTNTNTNMIQEQQQVSMEATSSDMISTDESSSEETIITSANNINHTKVWTEWTQELHDLFMDAVQKLGEGRCYPKDILELMNVPGLTRMQVASHLQKCRSGTWVPPNKRKAKVTSGANRENRSCINSRRFGFMPTNSHHLQQNNVDDASATHNYDEYNYFDEFPNIDSMIGGFSLFDDAVDDLHLLYSNQQVPAMMNNSDVEKWEEATGDAKIQVVIKEEEHAK